MMLPSDVAEQQAKLGVSAEESKAQRIKRQQSRFRDRGGAFVPSDLNPLAGILLARTVSGESPSKARPKDVVAKHLSARRSRLTSPTRKAAAATPAEESQAIAGSSRPKAQAPRKRKVKVVEPEVDPPTKPAPKRRGRPPKAQKVAPDPDTGTERPLANTKATAASKRKGKQRNTSSVPSDGKSKLKARAKQNPAKPVVELLASDDDRTLVEVPHKTKTDSKRKVLHRADDETEDDVPIVRSRVLPPAGEPRTSGTKTVADVKTAGAGSSGKKAGNEPASVQVEKVPKTNAKKRPVPRDEDEEVEIALPTTKKGKTIKSATQPELGLAPHTTKDAKKSEKCKPTGKSKRVEPDSAVVKPVEGDDERPPEKRKKEDNYDDRPRKAVKFSDKCASHSSQKLKENQSDSKLKSAAKQDESDVSRPKLTTKLPSRSIASKGPPLEVLERIKASAVLHLNRADSGPDELDCLS